jgi:hypothetical protein
LGAPGELPRSGEDSETFERGRVIAELVMRFVGVVVCLTSA